MRGQMTRMVGEACVMLVICFAPNQINYALAMAGKTRLYTKLHHSLGVLVFISSCLNTFIYGMSNKNYRHGYRKFFSNVCPRGCVASNEVSVPTDTEALQHSGLFIRILVRESLGKMTIKCKIRAIVYRSLVLDHVTFLLSIVPFAFFNAPLMLEYKQKIKIKRSEGKLPIKERSEIDEQWGNVSTAFRLNLTQSAE